MTMKALTLRHPWPWAVCYFGKDLENRVWRPSQLRLGDRLAIHAGKMPSLTEIREAFAGMDAMGAIAHVRDIPTLEQLRRQESAIVAVVKFGGATASDVSPWFCGPYGWRLYDLVVLPEPVKCRGARGLWDVPPDVLAKMRSQFSKEGRKV